MFRLSSLLSLAFLPLLCSTAIAQSAQSYVPQHILFKGDTAGYSTADLLTAAGLKKGMSLTLADMNAHTKQLMDTGVFQDVSFTYNGQDLVYQLVPAAVLVPIEFENLPLATGPELDARLRAHIPLYRGKVPTEGALLDGVRKELEAALKEEGIDAHITTASYTDAKLVAITAETFTVSSPDISIGPIQLDGVSADFLPLAGKAASRVTGAAYSNQGSLNQIHTALANVYGERGYLGATYRITQGAKPIVDAAGAHIPFTVSVTEGVPYKLSAVTLAPDLIVTQQAFDKQSGMHAGETVSLAKLRGDIEFLTHQYRDKGYMHAEIHAQPSLDSAAATVSYAITAVPGPVYTMGALRVVNVPDELHDPLLAAWRIPAGSVFNESMARNLAASPNLAPELKRILSVANIHSTLKMHEDIHTVDVELTLVRKPL